MWTTDLEAEVEDLLRSQGFDPACPPDPILLAYCVLGAANVATVPGMRTPARYVVDRDRIELSPKLSPMRRRFLVAHELGERQLRRRCHGDEYIEQKCDSFAAALMAPRAAVRAALDEHGRHLPSLASALEVSESIAALRLGEVTGSPLALVTPRSVRVRGDAWVWPAEREIRQIAGSLSPSREIERVAITDAPRRVVLAAAA